MMKRFLVTYLAPVSMLSSSWKHTPPWCGRLLHCGISIRPMTAWGHKRTKQHVGAMSALPLKADKQESARLVRFVPKADERAAAKFLIRSPRGAKWSASH